MGLWAIYRDLGLAFFQSLENSPFLVNPGRVLPRRRFYSFLDFHTWRSSVSNRRVKQNANEHRFLQMI